MMVISIAAEIFLFFIYSLLLSFIAVWLTNNENPIKTFRDIIKDWKEMNKDT
jgi:hypothetical protein